MRLSFAILALLFFSQQTLCRRLYLDEYEDEKSRSFDIDGLLEDAVDIVISNEMYSWQLTDILAFEPAAGVLDNHKDLKKTKYTKEDMIAVFDKVIMSRDELFIDITPPSRPIHITESTTTLEVDLHFPAVGHFTVIVKKIPKRTEKRPKSADQTIKYNDGTRNIPVCVEFGDEAMDELVELLQGIPFNYLYFYQREASSLSRFAQLDAHCIATCNERDSAPLQSCVTFTSKCSGNQIAKMYKSYPSTIYHDSILKCEVTPEHYFEVQVSARVFKSGDRVVSTDKLLDEASYESSSWKHTLCMAMRNQARTHEIILKKCQVPKLKGLFLTADLKLTYYAYSTEKLRLINTTIAHHLLNDVIKFQQIELHLIKSTMKMKETVSGVPIPFTTFIDPEVEPSKAGKIVGILFGVVLCVTLFAVVAFFLYKRNGRPVFARGVISQHQLSVRSDDVDPFI